MKKLIFSSLCVFATSTVFAVEKDYCSELGRLATTIMELRQKEYPMSKIIAVSEDEVVKSIIKFAYQQKAYHYEDNQKRAVAEFANDVMAECYKKGYDKE